jgi:tetratricopeptide (TPR) repeat protein
MTTLFRPAALLAAFALSTVALADRITLADGRTIDGVEITNETLGGVLYKQKGKAGDQNVPADQVLEVEFTNKVPGLISSGLAAIGDGNLLDATQAFEDFAETVFSGSNKKDKQAWAPGYALAMAIETNQSIGTKESTEKILALADLLISKTPESRYVPFAYLAKAGAQRDLGKAKEAAETAGALKALVQSKALSDSYVMQAELLEAEIGGLSAAKRRDRFVEIGGRAGSTFPVVRNRARVLEAETYLEGEAKDYAKARKIYEAVTKDPKADGPTLAGAYSGMGDCLFQEAVEQLRSNADASATLKDAVLNYLRVVIVYKDQTRYVPRACFQAGKVFEFMGEDNRPNAITMYRKVVQEYPTSEWATKAKDSRR